MEGEAVMASADSSLRSLGNFIITHYCPCSICCGPWRDGITSTGATAVTNRTIAVDPTVIPYGSKVVINGQVYVAEDCGGAIKNNHIDIYVGSHAEAETKGDIWKTRSLSGWKRPLMRQKSSQMRQKRAQSLLKRKLPRSKQKE